ncbi:MAG: carbon monoxide dehydrogenase, partial [Dehalococcoidales bacterium]|nr:carbon monoxide dehydrogenase [Dehalococcoidales bacterium]
GIRTVARIKELISELKLVVKNQLVIITSVPPTLNPHVAEEITKLGINNVVTIPFDEEIYEYDLELKPLLDLPDTSKAVMKVSDLMDNILNK